MGCLHSRHDINDTHANIFAVQVIDETGRPVADGSLEITSTTLVLYQRGAEAVRWPIKSLRRYGVEAGIFSFEAGRRCATGSGIYAFRCSRADRLLNTLQAVVRQGILPAGQASPANTMERPLTTHAGVDRQQSGDFLQAQRTALGAGVHRISSLDSPDNAAEADVAAGVEYANVTCSGLMSGSGASAAASANGYLVPNALAADLREYENVLPQPRSAVNSIKQSVSHSIPLPPKIAVQAEQTNGVLPDAEAAADSQEINYISVDFDTAATPASPTTQPQGLSRLMSEASPEPRGEYSTIDINRTRALSATAMQFTHRLPLMEPSGGASGALVESPVGVRKTRHSSTLTELAELARAGLGKRNSVLGD